MIRNQLSSLELCAGADGLALGLEQAGLGHQGLVEIDSHCGATFRLNRPGWRVFEKDLPLFAERDGENFTGIALLATGLPGPPFSLDGKQLGDRGERNLFPVALDLIDIVATDPVTKSFTDSQGRTTLYRYSLKDGWHPTQPRGLLVYFHGNSYKIQ